MQTADTVPSILIERRSIRRRADDCARRTLDITAAGLGLLMLAPLFLLLAIAIKRDTPGPVFYRGARAGRRGLPFSILKFRTMYDRPASFAGASITAADDDRVTPLGRWLRSTKLNELPQLWNVLMGDMSLVGPRPEAIDIAEQWPATHRRALLSVRPGITSPATVVFRNEEDQLRAATVIDDYLRDVLPTKLRIDALYIRSRSIFTDLDVIFMTMACLLPSIRAVNFHETTLYWGPIARFVSRFLNWFLLDFIISLLAVSAAGIIWRMDMPLNLGLVNAVLMGLAMAACFSIANIAFGLNRVEWRRAPAHYAVLLTVSSAMTTALLATINTLLHAVPGVPGIPHGMVFIAGFLSLIGFVVLRYRQRLLTGFSSRWLLARGTPRAVGERVLVIGAGQNSQLVTWLLSRSEYARLFSIVGFVDDDPRKQGMYVDGYRILGATTDIPALIRKHDIGLVLYTISNINLEERQRILAVCSMTQVPVVPLPDLLTELLSQLTILQNVNTQSFPER
jgi:lipopolysaccharide/colanic/teichoic acid biosynthesis glycosyltransferase